MSYCKKKGIEPTVCYCLACEYCLPPAERIGGRMCENEIMDKQKDGDMKQTEEIKAIIREMMDREMENFKEAVSNGEADETASPVVYTMLQVLLAKIEAMPNTPPDNKPEPEPQAKTVTQDEYFREVSTLNGKIRELEQKLSAEQQAGRKQKKDTEEFLRKSEACLDAVSAMLECSGGATHRMRDFYATAMMKFIGNTKKILRSYADPMPF